MKKNERNPIFIRGLLITISIVFNFAFSNLGSALEVTKQPDLANSQQNSQSSIFPGQISKTYNITLTCNPCYYVDSKSGSDSNSGTQPDKPWKTLSKLTTVSLSPGTVIYLKRGSVWTEKLRLTASGQSGNPITITAYGSGGDPILSNPGDTDNTNVVLSLVGNFIVIDHLHIQDSGSGINIFSNYNIIQNSEINNTGIGIGVAGQYNLITRNYIHDTRMVLNTPGGTDDWGANGIDINNAHNEISYNRFVNTEAPSYDFGTGGGPIEIYKEGDYTSIHHNQSFNSAGFIEVGGNGTGTANYVRIFYNLVVNSTRFSYITFGTSSIQVQDFRVENNTIVDLRSHSPILGNLISFKTPPPAGTYILRNNIIYISDYYRVSSYAFTHQNNIYYFLNPTTDLGFTLDTGEKIVDPQFYDIANYNFHLKSTSPAINAGINLGYTEDLDQHPVPINTIPDIGAYESAATTISGNAGIGGTILTYTDRMPQFVMADGSGNYSITVPIDWSGTITPHKIGYAFTPSSKSYSTVQSNRTGQDYAASVCAKCADTDTVGVFRPSNGLLYLKNLNITGFADVGINYGLAGDYPVVGDWDGNGTATIGIYRNGSFYLRNSNTVGFADIVIPFGMPGDQPIAGDWNTDGIDTIGVFRPATAAFFLRNSNSEGLPNVSFFLGNPGDVAIAGDWNGDGTDTTGVFRPANGVIFLKNSNTTGVADVSLNYGIPGDKSVVGDWNNDGTDTIGIYRGNIFYLRNSNTVGFADLIFALGDLGDMPIAGNWDGLP